MSSSRHTTSRAHVFLFPLLLVAGVWPRPAVSFPAWVSAPKLNIRSGPASSAPVIGDLERGTEVVVERCVPACDVPSGWALLRPEGAVRLRFLVLGPAGDNDTDRGPGPQEHYLHGKVGARGAVVFERESERSRKLTTRKPGDVLALVPGPPDAAFLAWAQGGFVRRRDVKLYTPSAFEGVRDPTLPLTFTRRAPGSGAGTAVRTARAHAVPAPLRAPDRWVHVSLAEQTLVAYEGDVPRLATLVSTGKRGFRTRPGLFRVWLKARHVRMHGDREPYDVEEVPSVMFFDGDHALHGAFWHDAFGAPISHGCVNLSVADAAWLFAWAPPPLPTGWHSIVPLATTSLGGSLHVLVTAD